MHELEGLTNEEIKELIQEHLEDADVDVDAVEIEVTDGPRVTLGGKVDSEGAREVVKQVIIDMVGIEENDIEDELVVVRDESDHEEQMIPEEEDGSSEEYQEDDLSTEDASQSLEEGIPYIPPTSLSTKSSLPEIKRRRKYRYSEED